MSTIKCKQCEGAFTLKELSKAKGRCPSCGTLMRVSDYCAYVPERRWWRLFSAAPVSMKLVILLCSILCAFFLPCQVLTAIYPLLEDRYYYDDLHITFGWLGFFLMPILLPVIWGDVRGRVPFVSLAAVAVYYTYSYITGNIAIIVSLLGLAIVFLPLYFAPSAIRWRTRRREERLAFAIAAKSGADLSELEVREYPLKKVAICIYLILVLGVLWIMARSELDNFVLISDLWG